MNPEAANELRRIIEALLAGQATAEEQAIAGGFLQPACVVLAELPEHLLQILMFSKPVEIEVINLVMLHNGKVVSMNDEPGEAVPS